MSSPQLRLVREASTDTYSTEAQPAVAFGSLSRLGRAAQEERSGRRVPVKEQAFCRLKEDDALDSLRLKLHGYSLRPKLHG